MMALFAFAVMMGLKKISPRIPGVLVAVAATTLISWATGFEQRQNQPLAALADADLRTLIVKFNAETSQMERMQAERNQINDRLKEANADPATRLIAIERSTIWTC